MLAREPVLSSRAERFLCDTIGSVQNLDCLILVGTDPTRWWSAASVARELRAPVEVVTGALEQLAKRNLLDVRLASDIVFRYAPWHEADALVAEITTVHCRDRAATAALLFRHSPHCS